MLTNVKEYLKLPLDKHPLTCMECDSSLLTGDGIVVWKFAYNASEVVLCRECGERAGFWIWTDSLRPKETKDDNDC